MNYLLTLAHAPAVTVTPEASVLDAVKQMSQNRVGAVGVVSDGRLVGIFTERDVMERVVLHAKDPASTDISSVMTSPVDTASSNDNADEALERMVERHIRHLPVVDGDQRILGMLSIRNLLQDKLEKVQSEAESLEAYMTADGIGG